MKSDRPVLLIVEDDPALLRGLREGFDIEGFEVRVACDGNSAVDLGLTKPPDVVLLDIMLPGLNGLDVCQVLREAHPTLPILILSARGSESDVVRGLNLDADDCVTKPFSIVELRARVRAVMRRARAGKSSQVTFGPFELDLDSRTLMHAQLGVITLTRQEFGLTQNRGRVLTRERLLTDAWDRPPLGRTRTVDRVIASLRKKIEEDPGSPRFIRTERGVGYRFSK